MKATPRLSGYRKLIMAAGATCIGAAMAWTGHLTGGEWVTLALGCVASLSAANAVVHASARGRS